jgi:hypothetical protein
MAPTYFMGYPFDTLPRRIRRLSTRNDQRRSGLGNFRHGLPKFVIRSSGLEVLRGPLDACLLGEAAPQRRDRASSFEWESVVTRRADELRRGRPASPA